MRSIAIALNVALAGSVALAAQREGTEQQPRSRAPEEQLPSNQAEEAGSRPQPAREASGCAPTDEDVWFAPNPRLVECVSIGALAVEPLTAQKWRVADANDDGTNDYFRPLQGSPAQSWVVFAFGEDSPELTQAVIMRESVDSQSQQLRLTKIKLFSDSTSFRAWCTENLPPVPPSGLLRIYIAYNDWTGWRDMDGDRDLDLLLIATDDATWVSQIWVENIGFEKPTPPLAADLNGDGWVNGIDLGMLLGAWGRHS
jgi:hypothetical protein